MFEETMMDRQHESSASLYPVSDGFTTLGIDRTVTITMMAINVCIKVMPDEIQPQTAGSD